MSPKETLRGEIKKILKNTSRDDFFSQGRNAARLLCSSRVWSQYKTVFLFLSMNSEIDTLPLIETALKEGKRVFAPRVEAAEMVFYPVLSLAGPWRRGPYGIREPDLPPGFPAAAPADFPALILAPGLAFDREGNRLGRGGGYYDRFFAELDQAGMEYTALGLCMDFQVIDRVPAGVKDKKMHSLLTGKPQFIA